MYQQNKQTHRLPIHPFVIFNEEQSFKFIESECYEDSMEGMLLIAKLLGLPTDSFYMMVAENISKRYAEGNNDDAKKKNEDEEAAEADDLMLRLKPIVLKINSPQKSLAVIASVIQKIPSGLQARVNGFKW